MKNFKNDGMYETVGRLDGELTADDRGEISKRLGELSGKYLEEAKEVIGKLNDGSELTEIEKVKIACWLGWLNGGKCDE